MSIPERLTQFLKKYHIQYEVMNHPKKFTSMETAEAEHVPGKAVAKVVMFKTKGKDVMAVLPATYSVDLLKFSTLLGTQDVRIEREAEFTSLFPDCEAGAMPPIPKLYHLPCYVDQSLKEEDFMVFNAGSHTESIKMTTKEFFRVVKATVGDFAVPGRKVAV